MAENKNYPINISVEGDVNVTEEVVAIIAGLGALEVEGVNTPALSEYMHQSRYTEHSKEYIVCNLRT